MKSNIENALHKEVIECPNCESPLKGEYFFRKIIDEKLGKVEEKIHKCSCGYELVLDRKIIK
ncbi:MAG: hypothetical protein NT161_00865 [Candidatus Nomurabacteria bacterium]|nr:hypothetical protein [Candidatus Nomurabacteria bacterium]